MSTSLVINEVRHVPVGDSVLAVGTAICEMEGKDGLLLERPVHVLLHRVQHGGRAPRLQYFFLDRPRVRFDPFPARLADQPLGERKRCAWQGAEPRGDLEGTFQERIGGASSSTKPLANASSGLQVSPP